MKIAIPTADGLLCPHFGQSRQFAIIDIDTEKKEIIKTEMITPPPHERGILPQWLSQMGCNLIIAGGMGGRAINMFEQKGIGVISGASPQKPEQVVMAYLNGGLITGGNLCDEPGFRGDRQCEGKSRPARFLPSE